MKVNEFMSKPSCVRDERVRDFITPKRVAVKRGDISGEENLLTEKRPQICLAQSDYCVLSGAGASVTLDYGAEFSGSVKIFVQTVKSENGRARLGVRFGESLSEATTPLGEKGSVNDHANRDFEVEVSALSANETCESGLRFATLTLLEDATVGIYSVAGVFYHRNAELRGAFECSDEVLNAVWNTAVYTVYLNMQEYLWDGIKRDRLVWAGDMHTEIRTILAAFGANDIIPRSLNLLLESTQRGKWMNNISSYSIWWLIAVKDWYVATGDAKFLNSKKEEIFELLGRLIACVGDDGREELTDMRFLDWQSSKDPEAIHAGLQGLMKLGMEAGAYISSVIGDEEFTEDCFECAERLGEHIPVFADSKQAAAMLSLAGICEANDMNERFISPGGARGYSAFMGYYILKAKAEAGDMAGALDDIRSYWGGMLNAGATSFWEDFDIEWTENSCRIDELPKDGERDIHGDFGDYCYRGHRNSLCHGWASGPCPFLSEYVLGVKQTAPLTYEVSPNLGDLEWARGKYPTPLGDIEIRAKRKGERTSVSIKAPHGVKVKRR